VNVIEVNRPDRATRHRLGKSDPIDAESAARAVLAGTATGTPKHGEDRVEMIRVLKLVRDSAVKSQTQATNQVKAVLVTAPSELREALADLPRIALLERCAELRPGALATPLATAKHALRLLARRALTLRAEAKALRTELTALTAATSPALVELAGIGADSAAALLISAGDNPQRLRSEAAFAALCGTNPIPASSGKTNRYRLNRGGDRQANAALHRAIVTRMRWHEPTKAYVERRTAEGKTKPEIMRCLKRYLARQVYRCLLPAVADQTTTPEPKNLGKQLDKHRSINPLSEAQFKTLKYLPDFPAAFASLAAARQFCAGFFYEYNYVHHHSGIAWHTPASVHFGTADAIDEARQTTLTAAYHDHPKRFGHRPLPPQMPTQFWINQPAPTETQIN